ncbi:MAG: group 1 glycosyl transferase [Chitinophagaceae bacterium]|nr:group 1 glycosyl transferase [Chitinophagaceae bacterium]
MIAGKVLLPPVKGVLTAKQMPEIDFQHINNLTDDTGMIQHALFSTPNRKEGYCIDDNARALLLSVWACKDKKNTTAIRVLPIYLSFIHYMQTEDGYFRNFMNYTKSIDEVRGSEDSFGRTMMALGYLINEGNPHLMVKTGIQIFAKAFPHVEQLVSPRAIANSIIGLCQFVKYNYPDDVKSRTISVLSDKLVAMYEQNNAKDWHWFESVLTYDNAILPLALLSAWEITQDENCLNIAFEALEFLESKTFHKEIFRPIGNLGWHTKDGPSAQFDQQGIDVMAMVLCYQQAYRNTRESKYLDRMYKTYQWFLGANDLGVALYDRSTGGCADGLHSKGINLNQGAESTLAYWISHVVVAAELAGLKKAW